jgi:hypothetical protein
LIVLKVIKHGSEVWSIDPALCHFDPALCRIAQDLHTNSIQKKSHSAGSWYSAMPQARDHDPALCQHSAGPHVFVYISANSQQNSKIFYSMNQGPWWDCLMKKPEVENLVTLSLSAGPQDCGNQWLCVRTLGLGRPAEVRRHWSSSAPSAAFSHSRSWWNKNPQKIF